MAGSIELVRCVTAVNRGDGNVVRPQNEREIQVRDREHRSGNQNGDGKSVPLLDWPLHVPAERRLLNDPSDRSRDNQQRRHRKRGDARKIGQLLMREHDQSID